MKKSFSLLMSITLLFSLATPALAAAPIEAEEPFSSAMNELVSTYNLTPDVSYSGIYQDNSDQYYYADLAADEGPVLIPMKKITMSAGTAAPLDASDNDLIIDLPQEVLEGLNRALSSAQEGTIITLFAPDEGNNSMRIVSDTEWTYGTYNGVAMKNYLIYKTNESTDFQRIVEGPDTQDVAGLLSNIIMTATGAANIVASFLSSGISIFQDFLNTFGNSTIIVGTSSDYLSVNVSYDSVTKYTYAQNGSVWKFGLQSKQVKITKLISCQYYADTGEDPHLTYNYPDETISSANFESPYPMAYAHAMSETPMIESAYYTIHNTVFEFT